MGKEMIARQAAVAFLLALVVLAVPGLALVASPDPSPYCKGDIARLCPGLEDVADRVVACLKERRLQTSAGCARALKKAQV